MLNLERALGRTLNYNNHAFYSTDGFGRDGYISYNNGGYYRENYKLMAEKPQYPYHKMTTYYSLTKSPPPVRYFSDGTGRDTYVVHRSGGLARDFSPSNKIPLKDYLRNFDSVPRFKRTVYCSQKDYNANAMLNKIQKGVINRLYTHEKDKFLPLRNRRKTPQLGDFDTFSPQIIKSFSTKNMGDTLQEFHLNNNKFKETQKKLRNRNMNIKCYKADKYTTMLFRELTNKVIHE